MEFIKRRVFGWTFCIVLLCWMLFLANVRLQITRTVLPFRSYIEKSIYFNDTVDPLESSIDEEADFKKRLNEFEDEDLEKALHLVKELKEAKKLYEEVRILCWVLMYPKAHNTTARVLKETWGRRCNRLIFMSTQDDPSIGAIDVGSREGYHSLWNKTRSAVKYIYNNLLYDYDWFLKADDNTYVLVDNLRYMLRPYNTNDPVYFGEYYKTYQGYHTGGAGYVLGREAVKRFVQKAIPSSTVCKAERRRGEDVGMGQCMRRLGIKFGDTRDHLGQGRFWQLHPTMIFSRRNPHESMMFFPLRKGERPDDCCSDTVVSFHELTATDFYLLEYLIYKVRVFGHIPTLPLRVPLPPDLVPQRVIDQYRKSKEEETVSVSPDFIDES